MKPGGSRSGPIARRTPQGTHKVVLTCRVRQQFQAAPPILQAHLIGITAILRTDPTAGSAFLEIRKAGDETWVATFMAGRGCLTYWVIAAQRIVVLLDLVWLG
jgi:hypothetical protein